MSYLVSKENGVEDPYSSCWEIGKHSLFFVTENILSRNTPSDGPRDSLEGDEYILRSEHNYRRTRTTESRRKSPLSNEDDFDGYVIKLLSVGKDLLFSRFKKKEKVKFLVIL